MPKSISRGVAGIKALWAGFLEVLLRGDTRYSELSTGLLLITAGLAGLQPVDGGHLDLIGVLLLTLIIVTGLLRMLAAAASNRTLRTVSGAATTALFVWGGILGLNHITLALATYMIWAFVIAVSAYRVGRIL